MDDLRVRHPRAEQELDCPVCGTPTELVLTTRRGVAIRRCPQEDWFGTPPRTAPADVR